MSHVVFHVAAAGRDCAFDLSSVGKRVTTFSLGTSILGSTRTANNLGVYFTHDKRLRDKLNFENLIQAAKKVLSQWRRINLAKYSRSTREWEGRRWSGDVNSETYGIVLQMK